MGFKPIQGDYFEKPTGLTAEDLLKWDGTALARLAKGSNGQFLKTDSGALTWGGVASNLLFYIYDYTAINPVSLSTPTTILSDTTEYSTTSDSYSTVKSVTLNSSTLGSIYASGRYYSISWETKVKGGLYWNGYSNIPFFGYVKIDNTAQSQNGSTYTSALVSCPYTSGILAGSTINIQIKSEVSGYGVATKDNYIKILGYFDKLPSTITPSTMSTYGLSSVKYIELYDNGDSVKINNDSDLIFTGVSGQPTSVLVSSKGKVIDYDDITQVDILSGNPLIVFEKA